MDSKVLEKGEIVVLDTLTPYVQTIFDQMYKRNFPIASVKLIEEYDGDDFRSMDANNSSAFNGRKVTYGKRWSLHAYGAAIDINPMQNPFVDIDDNGSVKILPRMSATRYLNRSESRPNKSKREGLAEDIVDIFFKNGFFIWGGHWDYPIDYQHFQLGPRYFVEYITSLSIADGRKIIDEKINEYRNCVGTNGRKNQKIAKCAEKVVQSLEEFKKQ